MFLIALNVILVWLNNIYDAIPLANSAASAAAAAESIHYWLSRSRPFVRSDVRTPPVWSGVVYLRTMRSTTTSREGKKEGRRRRRRRNYNEGFWVNLWRGQGPNRSERDRREVGAK